MKKIQIKFKHPKHGYLRLVVRKTINGNIIVKDHNLMDIYIIPTKRKILSVPKEEVNDDLWNAQRRLFKFLGSRGIIDINSVQSGSIYGSMECLILNNDDKDTGDFIQVSLFVVGRFLEEEKKMLSMLNSYYEELDSMWTDPSYEDSTELGEVPHADKQGSMGMRIRPYGMSNRMMEGRFYDYRLNMKNCKLCESKTNNNHFCNKCITNINIETVMDTNLVHRHKMLKESPLNESLCMHDEKDINIQEIFNARELAIMQRVCVAVGKQEWRQMFDYNYANYPNPLPSLVKCSTVTDGLLASFPDIWPPEIVETMKKFSNWVHTLKNDALVKVNRCN